MGRESGINANWKATVCPALVSNVPMHVLSFISTRISDNHVDYYYRPQRSCGQGNVFTGVCLSTGGVSASVHAGMPSPRDGEPHPPSGMENHPPRWRTPPGMENPPGSRTPPGWRTPPGNGEPPPRSRLQHTVYERPVRILLECILVNIDFC